MKIKQNHIWEASKPFPSTGGQKNLVKGPGKGVVNTAKSQKPIKIKKNLTWQASQVASERASQAAQAHSVLRP